MINFISRVCWPGLFKIFWPSVLTNQFHVNFVFFKPSVYFFRCWLRNCYSYGRKFSHWSQYVSTRHIGFDSTNCIAYRSLTRTFSQCVEVLCLHCSINFLFTSAWPGSWWPGAAPALLINWLFTFSEYYCMPWEPISLPCFYNTFLPCNDRLFSNFPVFYLTKPQSIVPTCVCDCSNIVRLRYLQFEANPRLPCICWCGRILKLEM